MEGMGEDRKEGKDERGGRKEWEETEGRVGGASSKGQGWEGEGNGKRGEEGRGGRKKGEEPVLPTKIVPAPQIRVHVCKPLTNQNLNAIQSL